MFSRICNRLHLFSQFDLDLNYQYDSKIDTKVSKDNKDQMSKLEIFICFSAACDVES